MLDSLNIRRIGNTSVSCAAMAHPSTAATQPAAMMTYLDASAQYEEWDGEVVVGDMGQAVYHKNFLDPLWDRHCGSCITLTQSHLLHYSVLVVSSWVVVTGCR